MERGRHKPVPSSRYRWGERTGDDAEQAFATDLTGVTSPPGVQRLLPASRAMSEAVGVYASAPGTAGPQPVATVSPPARKIAG
jgi:hypothetical protein